jgi:hypothetical protein
MKAYQKELDKLLAKRDRFRQQQMDSYRNHTATRARTTTRNAEVGKLNERIVWLREQLKAE